MHDYLKVLDSRLRRNDGSRRHGFVIPAQAGIQYLNYRGSDTANGKWKIENEKCAFGALFNYQPMTTN